jgi:hypothetical protein
MHNVKDKSNDRHAFHAKNTSSKQKTKQNFRIHDTRTHTQPTMDRSLFWANLILAPFRLVFGKEGNCIFIIIPMDSPLSAVISYSPRLIPLAAFSPVSAKKLFTQSLPSSFVSFHLSLVCLALVSVEYPSYLIPPLIPTVLPYWDLYKRPLGHPTQT